MQNPEQSTKTAILFKRFAAIFGAQKVAAMWDGVSMADREAEWEPQLNRFGGRVIMQALQALRDKGSEWPPTLAEFLQLCRQYNRPEHQSIPALPMPTVSPDQARANLAKIRALVKTTIKRVPE